MSGGKVDEYLTKVQGQCKDPKIAEIWHKLEELHSKKQWHQLTIAVKDALGDEGFVASTDLVEFHKNFVDEFQHRLNPLSLVEIIIPIAKTIKDYDETVTLLEKIKTVVKTDKQAMVLCNALIAALQLEQKDERGRCPHIPAIRDILEQTESEMDELAGVTPVHGEFHKVKSVYLKEIGDFGGYYQEALRYLGCIDLETMNPKERQMQSFCLGLAALLGEEVYNFGELLAHPVLDSLKGTEEEWMVELLCAFNKGDHAKCKTLRKKWSGWDDLKKHEPFLMQKLRVLSVMELSFSRPAKERQISFQEIATAANVKEEEVEGLVMKTLSKGLIRGSIDQVDRKVSVSWVQPRVLDKSQIAKMAGRFQGWQKSVKETETLVGNQAEQIIIR